MFNDLPQTPQEFLNLTWAQLEPYYRDLVGAPVNQGTVEGWLSDWSELSRMVDEIFDRLYVSITVNTSDELAESHYENFLDEIRPRADEANQKLKQKLLASGLEPVGFEVPLRNMRAEVELFRQDNLKLLSEESKQSAEYSRIVGAQSVNWEGRELTIPQLQTIYQDADRSKRERAWRLGMERQLQDRQAISALWAQLLERRGQLAANAGLPGYRDYRWQQLLRFDYSPQDCFRFHQAIEEVVVPAAQKIYEKRRQRLGVASLRPWDLYVDPFNEPPLAPFQSIQELEDTSTRIFHRVDSQFGAYFENLRQEGLLDLENRKDKAPGAYAIGFDLTRKPFVFANAVGIHDDVLTVLHEAGHAFHHFEASRLPYFHQLKIPMEFNEVASMSMELLAAPYLAAEAGGFYNARDSSRARIDHLERLIMFWPYMAVVDAFQHWVYENLQEACDPDNCDAAWGALWDRFMRGVDWSGLEAEKAAGWQRKVHIHEDPFYYIEYGLAQLGALQVWSNALQDQAGATAAYRRALALGGTVTLPELYAAAGARFAFDSGVLREMIDLAEQTIERLEVAVTGD
jgi:oligoendopeptidase F